MLLLLKPKIYRKVAAIQAGFSAGNGPCAAQLDDSRDNFFWGYRDTG
jgi:hypothetical protein